MESWFLKNEERLSLERRSISELEQRVDWLQGLSWTVNSGLLHLEAIVVVDDNEYNIVLSYPRLFPDVPAWVKPKNSSEDRWSDHQYGSGTLCLEWGQDNWHPELTGAQLLESTHKLLDVEKPRERGIGGMVESRHSLTTGQGLRSIGSRLFVSASFSKYLSGQKELNFGKLFSSYCFNKDYLKFYIQKVEPTGGSSWVDNSIPSAIKDSVCKDNICEGVFYRINDNFEVINKIKTLKNLKELLSNNGFDISLFNKDQAISTFTGSIKTVLIIDIKNVPHLLLFLQLKEGEDLIRLNSVFSEIDLENKRKPKDLEVLKNKSVGVVGVGSVGSKISISLARSGILSFYLVDEDIFLPENICRNALNWRNVGEHKVDSVSYELELINPDVNIKKSKINLTAQESSSSISSTLNRLGECDIIIDATGSQGVFNILASISKSFKRPMVWGEVFEGGVGGLIARSRPGNDPEPLLMRSSFLNQISSFSKYKSSVVGKYESEDENGVIIAASDSEVGIISNHMAELAIDTIINSQNSVYPYSMYLIGLKKAWIFKAPFDTLPIKIEMPKKLEDSKPKKTVSADHKKFILEAIKNKKNESSATKKN